MKLLRRRQSGQSIVIFGFFAATLFVFMGLGIDSGMLYVERRHLQNVADAACLAASTTLGTGGTDADAQNAAIQYITDNMNANAAHAFELSGLLAATYLVNADDPADGVNDGANLTRGIEIKGKEVRVAVNFPAFTYFMRLAGIETYNVMARARCNPIQGGGVLPIAVVRFPGYDPSGNRRVGVANTDLSLPQEYGNFRRPKYVKVKDILQREVVKAGFINDGAKPASPNPDVAGYGPSYRNCLGTTSDRRNWYDWGNGTNPDAGYYNKDLKTGPYYSPDETNCVARETPYEPGAEVEMIGKGANPNVGDNSFLGAVLLDVRNFGDGTPELHNGQSGTNSTNAWKNLVVEYIRTRYPGPDVVPSDEIAVLSGVNAGQIIDAVQDRYKVGDIVTTVVYDGQVRRAGDFALTIVCKQSSDNPGCNHADVGENTVLRPQFDPAKDVVKNSTSSKCEYSGQYFIADRTYDANFTGAPLLTGSANNFYPAKYIVELAPVKGAATNGVFLTARLSGTNEVVPGNKSGNPEGFGRMKVRWTDAATGALLQDETGTAIGWQDGDKAVKVSIPASGSVRAQLEVIQTEWDTTALTCGTVGSPGTPTAGQPRRVGGSHTIQVMAREATTHTRHSVYGLLGMCSVRPSGGAPDAFTNKPCGNGTDLFQDRDYYLAYLGEPVAVMKSNDAQTIDPALSLVDADADTEFAPSEIVNDWSVVWYKLNVSTGNFDRISGNPPYMSAALDLTETGGNAVPKLSISIAANSDPAVAGNYAIDLQLKGSTDPAKQKLHSTRFHLRVENGINASIDSWIVALCYANFELTDFKPNYVKGRALSGCVPPEKATTYLTGRMQPW